ncbi:MAG TPA: adenylate/guanylate cyclase domain-containing protein [Polyangiales bacterium]|jgi:class 3 adenylate cyclase|nr:adenylate/guanylate cyclase domain-containing protein [Polyangiales bacterium]
MTSHAQPFTSHWQAITATFRTESRSEGLQVLLVTDLVSFTNLVVALGDFPARQIMRAHNRLLRRCFKDHGGREVTHTGDGMFGAFTSVRRAINCAVAIRDEVAPSNVVSLDAPLQIRIGLHLGEPLPEEQRLFGACVNTAVRICASAEPGTILASEVVRQAAIGHSVEFTDRGSYLLKGLARSMQLYEVAKHAEDDALCPIRNLCSLERETGHAV